MGNILKMKAYEYARTMRKKVSITHLTNYTGIRYVLLKYMIEKIKNLHVFRKIKKFTCSITI